MKYEDIYIYIYRKNLLFKSPPLFCVLLVCLSLPVFYIKKIFLMINAILLIFMLIILMLYFLYGQQVKQIKRNRTTLQILFPHTHTHARTIPIHPHFWLYFFNAFKINLKKFFKRTKKKVVFFNLFAL